MATPAKALLANNCLFLNKCWQQPLRDNQAQTIIVAPFFICPKPPTSHTNTTPNWRHPGDLTTDLMTDSKEEAGKFGYV